MSRFNYWRESIEISLREVMGDKFNLSSEQLDLVAKDIESEHENYSTFSGDLCIPNPLTSVVDDMRRNHTKELSSVESASEESKKELLSTIHYLRSVISSKNSEIEKLRKNQ